MRGCGGETVAHVAVEFRPRRITGVARIEQAGVGIEPTQQFIDALVALDRFGECAAGLDGGRDGGELAAIALLEGHALGVRAIEIALDLRGVDRRIAIAQVPFWQPPELGGGARLGRRVWSGRGGVWATL